VQLRVSVELHAAWSVGDWLRHRRRTNTADDTAEQITLSGTARRTARGIV